ncbi:coiled-coil and C2 domain-containing protein 1B-like [Rhizophagus irregularis DAOM 181602=DAOM 197198]|nr:coiled-coil and C2 domain-containing protein 1B-like [Rhizophagus irregularis DAOM 181602=DAOM 197198]
MFKWSKAPNNSDKIDLGSLGIEGLDDLDIPMNDDFDEMDLNDPDLLGELNALSSSIQRNKPKSKSKPQPQPQPQTKSNLTSIPNFPGDVDIDAINALGAENDDHEVEFTEDDMKDPNLLKELQGLGGHQNDEEKIEDVKKITATEKIVVQETQTKVSKDNSESLISQSSELQVVEEQSIEDKLQSNDVDLLAKYIQEEKFNALMKKREGDKAGAVESVKAYKQLEAKRAQLLSQSKQVSEIEVKSENIQVDISAQQKTEISSRNQEIIDILNKKFMQYKEAAIKFKTSDIPRAKEFLNTATDIRKIMKSLENGANLPEGWGIPGDPDVSQREPVPQSPPTIRKNASTNVTPVSTPKKRVLTVLDNAINASIIDDDEQPFTMISTEEQYARLISQLESQVALCTTLSAYYLKTGNKVEATTFYRYKKSFAADLTSLISYRTHGKDVPAFHFQDITYSIENAFLELSANDMEVCIVRAYNLGSKEVNGKDVDAFVSWDIGWPTEGSPGAGSGKGDTSTAPRGMDPVFNWKKVINIERTKAFQRYVSSKKATFEVFHYRGFLRKAISLGKATIKLEQFLNKAEIHQVLDLVDHLRKPTGGKLEIRLRIRIPLTKADIVAKTEKWLIIDEFNTNNSTFASLQSTTQASTSAPVTPIRNTLQSAPVTPIRNTLQSDPVTPIRNTLQSDPLAATPKTPQQTPIKPKVTSTPKSSVPPSTPISVKNETPSQISTPVPQQKATPHRTVAAATPSRDTISTGSEQNDLEQAVEQLNNVDALVSNLVIQHEVEAVDAQIATLEAQHKSIPDDLTDRKNALEIKQNLLVIQVQTGQLTMDKYLDQVRISIVDCKKLALVFKKANKLDEAKKALGRSKIMEGEVKEVEEAMASGAIE